MSKYKALDVASFFIKKGVTPLKLQKLLYYAQVWFFVKTEDKLFKDDISAWIYGPVVYDVWDSFRFMKRSNLIPTTRAKEVDVTPIETHLNEIWSSYGHLSGSQLIDMTHEELPWKNSRKGLLDSEPSKNKVIINRNTTRDFHLDNNNRVPFVDINNNATGHFSNF